MHYLSATIHLGHGLQKTITDLVVDCPSKRAAKQKYYLFLKKELPEWQKVGKVSVL